MGKRRSSCGGKAIWYDSKPVCKGQEIAKSFQTSPIELTFGIEQRRTGPRPATMPVSVAATSLKTDAKPAGKSIPTDVPDNEPKGSKASQPQKPSQAERQHSQDKVQKPPTKRPVLKREQSDIFKSFSKPKAKTTRENTGSSSEAPSGLSTPKLVSEPCIF